ncbi:S1C family serine protease [Brachybacterium muris]|uniref:S1C family serine protease n=1 Tax=Brachybacterium muris TaxID=219301 RepID=UPI00352044BD
MALALAGCTGADTGPAAPDASPASSASEPAAVAASAGGDWSATAAQVAPSVVSITVRTSQGGGAGSGVIIDEQGHVVTNHHVIAGATEGGQILVTLADERVFEASVLGSDQASDLAVLEIADAPADLTPIEVADSDELVVGEPVMAVGNPLGLSGTVTTGIVSALDRPVTAGSAEPSASGAQEPVVTNAIQTSAAINPGNSGGALVDANGQLVGINSSIAALGPESGNIGIGFAITSRQMRSVVDQILETGTVQHAYLGVGVGDVIVEVDGAQRWAAGVANVAPDGPAAQAGLQEGDGILAIDDEAVDSALSLIAQIRERPVGTEVTLDIIRDGEAQQLTVTLDARP